ncbi:hypothetical protein ACPTE9_30185, partial [Pseudomonas aeruginosa]|uniref:hypothetical protein n=1 Tax=Pseudomonas aeruginosa TaxID=287 RepID=UPI003CC510B9
RRQRHAGPPRSCRGSRGLGVVYKRQIYEFKGGRYFVDGLDNNEPMYDFGLQVGPRDFTPEALRREGN